MTGREKNHRFPGAIVAASNHGMNLEGGSGVEDGGGHGIDCGVGQEIAE